MRVIITGGSGLIGRPLAAHLASAGHEVVVLAEIQAGCAAYLRTCAPTGGMGERAEAGVASSMGRAPSSTWPVKTSARDAGQRSESEKYRKVAVTPGRRLWMP